MLIEPFLSCRNIRVLVCNTMENMSVFAQIPKLSLLSHLSKTLIKIQDDSCVHRRKDINILLYMQDAYIHKYREREGEGEKRSAFLFYQSRFASFICIQPNLPEMSYSPRNVDMQHILCVCVCVCSSSNVTLQKKDRKKIK